MLCNTMHITCSYSESYATSWLGNPNSLMSYYIQIEILFIIQLSFCHIFIFNKNLHYKNMTERHNTAASYK